MSQTAFHPLRVVRVIDETADTRSFVLQPPAVEVEAFRYRAGQFLTLEVLFEGRRLHRCYSFSSSPEWDEEMRITVKRIADGRVSNWLNEHLRAGDTLSVMRPGGRFVLRDHGGDLLLFAGGSGITPVISLAKTTLLTTTRKVRLLYVNRDADSVIFRDTLAGMCERFAGRFEVLHRLDSEQGFIDSGAVTQWIAGHDDADFYICGPAVFMDIVEQALHGAGIVPGHVFIERFVSPSDGELPSIANEAADYTTTQAAPDTAASVPAFLHISLYGNTHHVPYAAGQTILQAARAAGLDPPAACEEGFCATCVARLGEGGAQMKVNDVLSKDEVEDGLVLTCQAVPNTATLAVAYED